MRLSLRWKIAGGFALMLVLIALLGWVTLSLFLSLRTIQRNVFDNAIPGLITIDEIVRSYTAQSAAVRGYLIGSQPSLLDQYRREVAIADVWEERGERLFRSSEERSLLDDLRVAGGEFQKLVDRQVIPRASRGERTQAFRVLGQEGTPLITEIETLGGLLRTQQDRLRIESERDVRSASNNALILLGAVIAGSLALGGMLAVLLPRRLVANLSRLVDAARAIERGDLDQKISVESRDEVGELAERFNEMQVGLKRLQQLALQDRELEIAASIQRNLLRRGVPHMTEARVVPLQRQANLVGGDWYDVDLIGRTLTVVVGDASGKGIAAALMATVALSALRAERGKVADPKHVLEAANRALRDASDPESFTTVIYSTLDLDTGATSWINMGHHSPFVLRAAESPDHATQGYYLEGPRNRALGWFEDPGLTENHARLAPGDRLVLFTDGFLEAKSQEGEVFGEHRLAEVLIKLAPLDGDALEHELVAEVERFAAGKLDDDLTMIIIEWVGTREGVPDRASGEEPWRSKR
ncbi:MAG TPA: SpoIIE family protein phosphatase [Actinomycetota bacterium]|nr:SpoIIE family protein phosphatase [Actinomycetota bacterium]